MAGGASSRPVRPLPRRRRVAAGKFFASLAGSGALLAGVSLAALFFYLRLQPPPAVPMPQTSFILDAEGGVLDAMTAGENRTVVPLSDISPNLVQATLAIEDHRFYEHRGIDPKGIARALLVNLRAMSAEQGASTLTQQLARNLYLTHDRTWSRKLKEAFYALLLESALTKEQILEYYLNEIYYGHGAYGAEAAARLYFGKSAKELTLAESALLAGIPKGPAYYSPYLNIDNAKSRQRLILDKMAEYSMITPEEAENAKRTPLALQPPPKPQPVRAPYFRDFVVRQAAAALGVTERELATGGYRIYTTLDPHAQVTAERVIARRLADSPDLQVALVAIDPRNGEIRAMVGGRDYTESQFNRAVSAGRQPGSAFKPIVYLAALEHSGFTPATRFRSEPTSFPYDDGRQVYTPRNFNNHYEHDWIALREAIAKSDNIYAVSTIRLIGEQTAVAMARRLGITSPLDAVPSLALGTSPVSPMELASAFATIANLGERFEPAAVRRIEGPDGRVLYEHTAKPERAVAPETAYVLTYELQAVFEPGATGHRVAQFLKRPAAGKTGTTDTDAWMVGFTPELATAVWVGHDRGRRLTQAESYAAAPIFAEFTEETLAAVPPKMFRAPERVQFVYIDPKTGALATDRCTDVRLEAFVAGTAPTEPCPVHGGQPHALPGPDAKERPKSWWDSLKRWWTG